MMTKYFLSSNVNSKLPTLVMMQPISDDIKFIAKCERALTYKNLNWSDESWCHDGFKLECLSREIGRDLGICQCSIKATIQQYKGSYSHVTKHDHDYCFTVQCLPRLFFQCRKPSQNRRRFCGETPTTLSALGFQYALSEETCLLGGDQASRCHCISPPHHSEKKLKLLYPCPNKRLNKTVKIHMML